MKDETTLGKALDLVRFACETKRQTYERLKAGRADTAAIERAQEAYFSAKETLRSFERMLT